VIFFVLAPSKGVGWWRDLCGVAREDRVLEPVVQVEAREGWGNEGVLNAFMRGLENTRRRLAPGCRPVFDKAGQFRIPVVKIVQ
jgi:hypothetical protein